MQVTLALGNEPWTRTGPARHPETLRPRGVGAALRARLGTVDPAVLSRALNATGARLMQTGLAEIPLHGLSGAITGQMRALRAAAVSVQLDVVRLKAEARDVMEAAQAAHHDSDLRVELLPA
ncbi:DNA-binding protein [Paraburkholderia strydomiana]|uniref:hypothetical protein n=1 Tax=Paraburkholderia strydomiana TaxID=1245417 RepID=UPI0038BC35C7